MEKWARSDLATECDADGAGEGVRVMEREVGRCRICRVQIRDEEAARLTKVDVHSLGKNRVNATLRNVDDFYQAFGITDGAMFLPEEERVVIW